MSSSDFRPLLDGADARGFRPLGDPAEGSPAAPSAAAPCVEDSEVYRAGLTQGREEARAEHATLTQALNAAVAELGAARSALPARWEQALLDVALGVARAIVRQELVERPEHWLAMLRDGIRRAVDRERVVVHVPPALASYLDEALPELRATLAEVRELTVLADAALAETACRIETRFGDVDLDVEAQLETARRTLLGGEV